MADKVIKCDNIKMEINVVDSTPLFAVIYFDPAVNYEKAKEIILYYEEDIKKAALEYVKDKEIEEKIINSTFTIIQDEENKYYVEFDELES